MRRLGAIGVAVALLLLAACGGDNDAVGPTATVPQPTTTTDPYAVPNVIDEAYVNRVLAGLDQAVGDVVRLVVSTRAIPPEAIDRLKAFYVGEALQLQVDLFQSEMFDNFVGYRQNPGNQSTAVIKLLDARATCIFAEVRKDLSAVSVSTNPDYAVQWIAIVPLTPSLDPKGYNPTNWLFIYDGFQRDLSAPPNPCAES